MRFVIEKSRSFVENSTIENLIHIREGITVGNWRDSAQGLGFAKIPYGKLDNLSLIKFFIF